MNKQDMVKALNRLYLALALSDNIHAQIMHDDDWENKALMRESVLTLLGKNLDDKTRELQQRDNREFEIWNYQIMYECVGYFKDICSWIKMRPELMEDYPSVFGHLFGQICKIESLYLDGITVIKPVVEVLLLCEKNIPDESLEEMAGIFLIEGKCIDLLRKIPRLKAVFDEADAALMPSDDELVKILSSYPGKLPSA